MLFLGGVKKMVEIIVCPICAHEFEHDEKESERWCSECHSNDRHIVRCPNCLEVIYDFSDCEIVNKSYPWE